MLFGAIPMGMLVEWEGKFCPFGREQCSGVALRLQCDLGDLVQRGRLYNLNSVEQVE